MTRIEVPNSTGRRRSPRRAGRWFIVLLLLLIIGAGLWTWLTLSWSYSDGERAGVLQKFSRKGWLCKSQEGEIAQFVVAGVSPQIWQFSVRDPRIAGQLDKAVGHRVQVHYTEHPGVPSSCFADTSYFVDRVTVTDEQPGPAPQSLGGPPPVIPNARPDAAPPAAP